MPSKFYRGILLLAVGLLAPLATAAESRRPNILFVFTDDHASHAISAYGSRINQTPNIDRLADEGLLLENCFVTNSICAPSRAVILTGKHSHLNSQTTNMDVFDGSQETFPKLLRQAGYQTALIGKWHLRSDPTGFDHWEILIGQGPYYNPPMIRNGERVKYEGYTTDIITDLALDWLREGRDQDKPFMLMCQHKAPHRNWEPGPDHLDLYEDVMIPEPPTLFDDWVGRTSAARMQEMTISDHMRDSDLKLTPPQNLTPAQLERWNAAYEPRNAAMRALGLSGTDRVRWNYQRYIKDYLRTIASVDDNLGRLLGYLEETGLAENTVVIYSSDQGFYLGDHGWYDKRWMYEESLRMPFIVRWPGVTAPGSRSQALAQNLDFAPTFLEIAGVEPPRAMQGASLLPIMQGEQPASWRESIYYHYYEQGQHAVQPHYGVRTTSHKLIHYYLIDEWEMFDLARDPEELRSVHENPEYAEVRRELEAELADLQRHYKVKHPTVDPNEAVRQERRRQAGG